MSTQRINIKHIVLGIIAIAISITIGYGIAKANAAKGRVSLRSGHHLGLQLALHHTNLHADLQARLALAALSGSGVRDGLNLQGAQLGTLGALEGGLLG
jgi:hypothetical protein